MLPSKRKKKIILIFTLNIFLLVGMVLKIASVKAHHEAVTSYLEMLTTQKESLQQLNKKIQLSYVDNQEVFLKDNLNVTTMKEIEKKLNQLALSKDKLTESKKVKTLYNEVANTQQETKKAFLVLKNKFTFQKQLAEGFVNTPFKNAIYQTEVAILPSSTANFFLSFKELLAKNFPQKDGWKKLMLAAIEGGQKQAQDLAAVLSLKEHLLAQKSITEEELTNFALQIKTVKSTEAVKELEGVLRKLQEKLPEKTPVAEDTSKEFLPDTPTTSTSPDSKNYPHDEKTQNDSHSSTPYPLTSYTGKGEKFLKESDAEAAGMKALQEKKAGRYQIIAQYFSDGSMVYYLELFPYKEETIHSSTSSSEVESTTSSSSETTENTEESKEEDKEEPTESSTDNTHEEDSTSKTSSTTLFTGVKNFN